MRCRVEWTGPMWCIGSRCRAVSADVRHWMNACRTLGLDGNGELSNGRDRRHVRGSPNRTQTHPAADDGRYTWPTMRRWALTIRSMRLAEIGEEERVVGRARCRGVGERFLQTVGVEPLEGLDGPGVEPASAVLQQASVGHLVRQRVLEGVLGVREQTRLVEELGRLE